MNPTKVIEMSEKYTTAGQPTAYRDEYCEMLIEHMKGGLSYESFSAIIGTCRKTLYNWEKSEPKFLHAKKKAFEASMLTWERIGIAQAVGDKKHGRGSTASWIFNMKNRFGWTDKHQLIDSDQEEIEWIE